MSENLKTEKKLPLHTLLHLPSIKPRNTKLPQLIQKQQDTYFQNRNT